MAEPNRDETHTGPGLGLITLSALVVANMVGAGVFTSSGYSLGVLGSPGRVMLAWWLCGVWAIAGAVAYGALARRLPLSGGEYLFLSRLVHPAVGFLAGWISVVAGFTAPIAVAAQGAAIYGLGQVDSDDWRLTLVAVSVIVFATLCHVAGVAIGTGLQNAIVAAKLVLLAVIIVWAFGFTAPEVWQGGPLPGESSQWWPEDWAAWTVLVGSMSWVALSYTGFNAAIYVAGQAREPRRTVPQSMLTATCAVTVIYLLLNYVFVYAPSPQSIANQNNVAAIAAVAIGGPGLSLLVRVTICLAMASSVFAMLLAGPRVYQKMAEDGVMPRFFRTAGGAPRLATLAQALLSIVAVFVADLLQLMKYLGLTLSACGALAVLSLWWARRRIPAAPALRRWETWAMSIYLAITFAILWASRTTHRDEFVAMLITFAVGGIVYAVWSWWEPRHSTEIPPPWPHCPPFQLLERLSSHSATEVYLAQQPPSSERLIVKRLPPHACSELNQQRWAAEVEVLSQLDHPHIVRLLDSGRAPDQALYLAVEYIPGATLWELVQRDGPLSDHRALPLLRQLASALAELHARGWVHGDLTPKNIMVAGRGSQSAQSAEGITLIDFGLAQAVNRDGRHQPSTLQQPSTLPPPSAGELVSGTPAFLSPESCQGRGGTPTQVLSPASEIYAFGCVAFFMVTGQVPFSGATSIEICWKQIHQPAPAPKTLVTGTLAPQLNELIVQCMDKSPARRPANMQAILQGLP